MPFPIPNGGMPPMMQNFQQFVAQMRGQNPQAMLNDMLARGQISQQQLNQVQQMAQQNMGMFAQFRSMLGL